MLYALPQFAIPVFNLDLIKSILLDAFIIAFLVAVESLLFCVVSDGMIKDKHNSNIELVAQGIGNIASGLFGGIPATGAIAITAANVKNGGRTPVSGMVHSYSVNINTCSTYAICIINSNANNCSYFIYCCIQYVWLEGIYRVVKESA